MKLISMTDFVIQEWEKDLYTDDFAKIVKSYADFLKQPLKLEMFVPVDKEGNVLEEKLVENYENDFGLYSDFQKYNKEYNQAKQKVLFEGFDLSTAKYHCDRNDRTIEYFTSFDIELTPNAIKKLEL